MKQYHSSLMTKQALADALKDLMNRKPFSRITVTDITKSCNFNRKTFYYHFADTISLLHWMLAREAVEVVRSYDLAGDIKAAIGFTVRYVRTNSHILNCAYDSLGREGIKNFLYNDFISIARSYIDAKEKELAVQVPDDYKNFLSRMYSEAIAGTLINLFTSDETDSDSDANDEKIIDYLSATIDTAVPASLQQFA